MANSVDWLSSMANKRFFTLIKPVKGLPAERPRIKAIFQTSVPKQETVTRHHISTANAHLFHIHVNNAGGDENEKLRGAFMTIYLPFDSN